MAKRRFGSGRTREQARETAHRITEQAERNLLSTGVPMHRMTSEQIGKYRDSLAHLYNFVADGLLHILMPDLSYGDVLYGLYMLWLDIDNVPERWLLKWVSSAGDLLGLLRYAAHLGKPVMFGDTVLDDHVPMIRKLIPDVGWSVRAFSDQHNAFVHLRYVR